MSKYDDIFLRDLARLLRHGEAPLAQLVHDLNDSEQRDQLVQALQNLGNVAGKLRKKGLDVQEAPMKHQPVNLGVEQSLEPERYDILDRIARQLQNAETLRDKRVLSSIAEGLHISVARKDSRAKIIQKIIDNIRVLPLADVQRVMNEIRLLETGTGESFKELAKFITRGHGISG